MLSSSSQPEGSPTEWGYVGCCSPARGCGLESWGCCWGRGEVEMGDTGAGCPLSHPTLSHRPPPSHPAPRTAPRGRRCLYRSWGGGCPAGTPSPRTGRGYLPSGPRGGGGGAIPAPRTGGRHLPPPPLSPPPLPIPLGGGAAPPRGTGRGAAAAAMEEEPPPPCPARGQRQPAAVRLPPHHGPPRRRRRRCHVGRLPQPQPRLQLPLRSR